MHTENLRERSTFVFVYVRPREREGLALWASSPMLVLHGLAYTAFGIWD